MTFDGSWNSTLYNATPIMQANHQTGVAYIVTNDVNELGAGQGSPQSPGDCGDGKCINWTEVGQLFIHGWDIASHTVNHANLVNETSDEYKSGISDTYELQASRAMLTANGLLLGLNFSRTDNIFAYPNGGYNCQTALPPCKNPNVVSEIGTNGYITARAENLDCSSLIYSGIVHTILITGYNHT